MRLVARAGVLCGLAFFGPSTAQGEVLTGHARSAVSSFSRSSPTRPILRNASIRYDSEQGSILVVARLHEALAPPSTRALGAWNVNVDLGEFIDPPFCLGRGSTDLTHLAAGPSDAIQASVRGAGAGSIEIGGHPVRSARVIKAMSADRTQIIVVAQSPVLAHRRWICWDAGIDKRDETEFSDTDPAFFDGHDNTDSPFGPYATTELATQISDLNRLLSGKTRLPVPGHTSCAQRHGTLATCRARVRLNDVAGRPILTVRGRVRYDNELSRWDWSTSVRLAWRRRCPRRVDPAREGRACALNVRWRGRVDLDDVLRRALQRPRAA